MSTQKAKFELFSRLAQMGFTFDESVQLRRIEMTLHRWDEQECGDGNNYASWAIERDEETNVPYRVTYPHQGKSYRTRIADREAGALRRLRAILDARNARETSGPISFYHQGDCRGCALYLLRPGDVPAGESECSYYTRGFAVAA